MGQLSIDAGAVRMVAVFARRMANLSQITATGPRLYSLLALLAGTASIQPTYSSKRLALCNPVVPTIYTCKFLLQPAEASRPSLATMGIPP